MSHRNVINQIPTFGSMKCVCVGGGGGGGGGV